jgi:hypothetical protein
MFGDFMTLDEKALSIIEKWESGTYYGGAVQKKAALQSLIVDALQAATLAEREKNAIIADDQVFENHVDCEGCATAKEIAAAIRKGEGV